MNARPHRDETIWIIGASSGIGAALAQAYADQGARLILSARSADKLAATADALNARLAGQGAGDDRMVRTVALDVSDAGSLQSAIAQVSSVQPGPIDRIIHLAALYDPGKIADLDPEGAADLVRVNLLGAFHVARFCPSVLRTGGQLAICGSVAGYVGLPQGQIYSATKAGVTNLVESLRIERPDRDIRLISPGFVNTPLTQKNAFDMPFVIEPEEAAERILRGLDGKRYEIHFPKRFTLMLKCVQMLPYGLRAPLLRRLVT